MQSARFLGTEGQRDIDGGRPQRPVSQGLLEILNTDWEAYPVVVPVPYHGTLYQATPSHNSTDLYFCRCVIDGRATAEPFRFFWSLI